MACLTKFPFLICKTFPREGKKHTIKAILHLNEIKVAWQYIYRDNVEKIVEFSFIDVFLMQQCVSTEQNQNASVKSLSKVSNNDIWKLEMSNQNYKIIIARAEILSLDMKQRIMRFGKLFSKMFPSKSCMYIMPTCSMFFFYNQILMFINIASLKT